MSTAQKSHVQVSERSFWAPQAYDGVSHFGEVAKALLPAMFILTTAAGLLLAIL